MKAHYILCTTIAMIDLALQSSWSGYNVIAEYNSVVYELYKDGEGSTHGQLMRFVAPNILDTDCIDTELRKYNMAACDLTKDWPDFNLFPTIDIDPNSMAYELKRAYNLI